MALFDLVAEFPTTGLQAAVGSTEVGVSVDDAAEWILRVILSLISVRGPRQRSPDGLNAFLRRFLLLSLLAPRSLAVCNKPQVVSYRMTIDSGVTRALTVQFAQFDQAI